MVNCRWQKVISTRKKHTGYSPGDASYAQVILTFVFTIIY